MTRVDHFNDPNAPKPNSIVVAATAFVQDVHDRVLLIQRSDSGLWALPGGAQDFGEYVSHTAVRETKEETGIDIEVTGLVGIYSDPRHLIEYANGEVRQQFSLCFRARPVSGEVSTSEESLKVRWMDATEIESVDITSPMRLRITHGLRKDSAPFIG